MNDGKAMKSNSHDRLIERRPTDVAAKTDLPSKIPEIDARSVAGAFMPRKPFFQQPVKVGEALRDHLKALLKENAVSWKVAYTEPDP